MYFWNCVFTGYIKAMRWAKPWVLQMTSIKSFSQLWTISGPLFLCRPIQTICKNSSSRQEICHRALQALSRTRTRSSNEMCLYKKDQKRQCSFLWFFKVWKLDPKKVLMSVAEILRLLELNNWQGESYLGQLKVKENQKDGRRQSEISVCLETQTENRIF